MIFAVDENKNEREIHRYACTLPESNGIETHYIHELADLRSEMFYEVYNTYINIGNSGDYCMFSQKSILSMH